jgi:hypothetical protein
MLQLLNSSPTTPLSTAGLSWYVHPDITDILRVAKKDSNTKRRFKRAKKPTSFQLTDTYYTTTRNKVYDKKTTYTCSINRNSDKLPMKCS